MLPYADTTNPQSLNKYQYCLDNPLRYIDPDGHQDSADLNMQRDDRDYLAGRITKEEYIARRNARGVGAAVGAAIVGSAIFGPRVGIAILSWMARNPDKVQQAAEDLTQASQGNPAPSGVPRLSGANSREMAREAIGLVKSLKGSPGQKAELFEALGKQITEKSGGAWQAVKMSSTDGSHVFSGGQGELLVINSKGQLFRGSLQEGGLTFGKGGVVTPNYKKLKELQ